MNKKIIMHDYILKLVKNNGVNLDPIDLSITILCFNYIQYYLVKKKYTLVQVYYFTFILSKRAFITELIFHKIILSKTF